MVSNHGTRNDEFDAAAFVCFCLVGKEVAVGGLGRYNLLERIEFLILARLDCLQTNLIVLRGVGKSTLKLLFINNRQFQVVLNTFSMEI
jgi:hypothetical protein